ncbi:hypothetical protein OB954_14960 [Aeromonas salmonicida]|nr:hypothetical protein [Aeromonas salmonicida]MDM5128115.1 hypothetical protein [Aeromonas salmonicida]
MLISNSSNTNLNIKIKKTIINTHKNANRRSLKRDEELNKKNTTENKNNIKAD